MRHPPVVAAVSHKHAPIVVVFRLRSVSTTASVSVQDFLRLYFVPIWWRCGLSVQSWWACEGFGKCKCLSIRLKLRRISQTRVPVAEDPPSLRRLLELFRCEEVNKCIPLRALRERQLQQCCAFYDTSDGHLALSA